MDSSIKAKPVYRFNRVTQKWYEKAPVGTVACRGCAFHENSIPTRACLAAGNCVGTIFKEITK